MLKSLPPFATPFSKALNQGMPAILTTTTIVDSAANASLLLKLAAAATAVPPNNLSVSRLFMSVPSNDQLGPNWPPVPGNCALVSGPEQAMAASAC